jgi:hypothetical protein
MTMKGCRLSNNWPRSASLHGNRSNARVSQARRVPRLPALASVMNSSGVAADAASSNSIGASASPRTACGMAPCSPKESISARFGKRATSQRAMSQPKLIVTSV